MIIEITLENSMYCNGCPLLKTDNFSHSYPYCWKGYKFKESDRDSLDYIRPEECIKENEK